MNERRLGRGLDFLISENALDGEEIRKIRLSELHPNPFQPRKIMDEQALKDLSTSIKNHGLLMPIVVRKGPDGYEIVAGERRWRASRKAGLSEIPCVVRHIENDRMLEIALVENIQRKDLDPIEKARAFEEMKTRLDLTQEDVAKRLGMSRAAVANFLRLLDLPTEIQDHVSRGTISFGHAKAIMSLEDTISQQAFTRKILAGGLSVREAEKEAKKGKKSRKKKPVKSSGSTQVKHMEESLMERLGTKVKIQSSGKGGKIIIDYYSYEDFERIFDMIGE